MITHTLILNGLEKYIDEKKAWQAQMSRSQSFSRSTVSVNQPIRLLYRSVFSNFKEGGPPRPSRSMMRPFVYFGRSLPCRGSKGPSAAWELDGLASCVPVGRRCQLVECVQFFHSHPPFRRP